MRKGGAIVNVASSAGLEGGQHAPRSAATRGAIHAFTTSLAQNLVSEGIRVSDASCISGEVLSLLGAQTAA
jgi:NAD(P)-dependent dehydrogenase (short-subunit alcohol dehydrogenase family)